MLDTQFIRENKAVVEAACKNKNVEVDLDQLLKLDVERRTEQSKIDELRRERNMLAGSGIKPSAADVKKGQGLKAEIAKLEKVLNAQTQQFMEIINKIPNIPSDDTPVGEDESANKILRQWGDKPKFDFKAKQHWELGKDLDLIDSERAAKISGSRSTFLKGRIVLLQFALIQFALSVLTTEDRLAEIAKQAGAKVVVKPFTPVLTPGLIRSSVFAKTGRLDPVEDKYYLREDELILAGSAEQALAPLHMDETIPIEQLPLRYVGYSTNFRREAGSYGKDVHGMLRQHQFDKLEMESFTTAEDGEAEQQFLVAIQEHLMQKLELPYQVVAISTGDMGKPDHRQLDIEAWLPGEDSYRETHSADWVTDFQARRLNTRYQDKAEKKLVHMNDATVLALGRTLIAIMENYQTKEGKVKIPEALQPYIKGSYL